jgi:hypothetical protein
LARSFHAAPIAPAPQPCQTLRTTKVFEGVKKISLHGCHPLALVALLTAGGGMLVSCNTPIGVSAALLGTYRENSVVTNPDGNGPQVVRWGPPENRAPPGEGGGSGR